MKIESTAPVEELPAIPARGWDDGYDWMAKVRRPWAPVPSWGRDGWDMGDWPLVIVLTCCSYVEEEDRRPIRNPLCVHCRRHVREAPPIPGLGAALWLTEEDGPNCPATNGTHRPTMRVHVYGVATYCEGDIERYAFERHEDRIAALDAIAQFYWRLSGEFEEDGFVPIGPLEAKWFGPFSFERAQKEEPLVVVEERQ